MITEKIVKEIAYQVYHRTGYNMGISNNSNITILTVACNLFNVDEDELLNMAICTVHELANKRKFNWLWD